MGSWLGSRMGSLLGAWGWNRSRDVVLLVVVVLGQLVPRHRDLHHEAGPLLAVGAVPLPGGGLVSVALAR